LEVAQIAREVGAAIGCDPDLVDTAGLSHDLGHPPFGHNGEAALDHLASEIGGFEGNAQSLRVLTRLEFKVFDGDRPVGLNLTRAALDATIKYPWPRQEGGGKFNFYPDDAEAFDWIRSQVSGDRRCLEAQVMDWSDDVAYSVHDVEDAIYGGYLDLRSLAEDDVMAGVFARAALDHGEAFTPDDLAAAMARLRGLDFWPQGFDDSPRALAGLKRMTSGLIGRFSQATTRTTLHRFGAGPHTRYSADLEVPFEQLAEVAVLKSVASRFVFNRDGVAEVYAQQRHLLENLVAAVWSRGRDALHGSFRFAWDAAKADDERFRVVIDQVASLTDVSAIRRHTELCGPAA
jgi:dGTPase